MWARKIKQITGNDRYPWTSCPIGKYPTSHGLIMLKGAAVKQTAARYFFMRGAPVCPA